VNKYENLADANSRTGTNSGKHDEDIFDIDVIEQDDLMQVRNAQEAIRMNGDELSTDMQTVNKRSTQDAQNFTSLQSITSQICKSLGDYSKNIA
jgi:hypothetical protein